MKAGDGGSRPWFPSFASVVVFPRSSFDFFASSRLGVRLWRLDSHPGATSFPDETDFVGSRGKGHSPSQTCALAFAGTGEVRQVLDRAALWDALFPRGLRVSFGRPVFTLPPPKSAAGAGALQNAGAQDDRPLSNAGPGEAPAEAQPPACVRGQLCLLCGEPGLDGIGVAFNFLLFARNVIILLPGVCCCDFLASAIQMT